MSLNKVFLMGNLTKDCELRYTPGGTSVCDFSLAVSRKFVKDGQQQEETCFVEVTVFGKIGENCSRYLSKGSPALIEGRLQLDQWEDRQTGQKRSKLRVVAESVQFIGSRKDDNGNSAPQPQQQRQPQRQSRYGADDRPQQPPMPPQQAFDPDVYVDDDGIPF